MSIFLYFIVIFCAILAYFKKKLTKSGALMACVVGSFITFGLGWYGFLLLTVFFVSSSMWSSFQKDKKENGISEKGARRDAGQVIANGGPAALLALLYGFSPSPILICGFVTSLAAANADTWASEIGILSKQSPLHLITWKRVEAGTSGAVTAIGTAAAFAGSFLIVACSIFFWWSNSYNSHVLLLALTAAGFIGNLMDTIIGATLQVVYRCNICDQETEQTRHCDQETKQIFGVDWINNDVVNFLCASSGALLGLGLGTILL